MASKFPNGDVLNLRVLSFSPVPPHPSWVVAHLAQDRPKESIQARNNVSYYKLTRRMCTPDA